MPDKRVALITGANKGIGLQIAKDLAAHGLTVLIGSRNLEKGEAAAKSIGPDARAVQLDVTDQASIAATARLASASLPSESFSSFLPSSWINRAAKSPPLVETSASMLQYS